MFGGANPCQEFGARFIRLVYLVELRPTQPGLMVKSPAATPMKSGLPSEVHSWPLGCLEPTFIQKAPGCSSTMGVTCGMWSLRGEKIISGCVRNLPPSVWVCAAVKGFKHSPRNQGNLRELPVAPNQDYPPMRCCEIPQSKDVMSGSRSLQASNLPLEVWSLLEPIIWWIASSGALRSVRWETLDSLPRKRMGTG